MLCLGRNCLAYSFWDRAPFSTAIDVRAAGKLAPVYASLYFEPWTGVRGLQ